ncbi:MAG TPA: hypothetical protein VJN90_05095, partial [Candidatus Acidoferrales bacterium]|nr:hypothetical protein [Candidatus Acidoferrales bacterium]
MLQNALLRWVVFAAVTATLIVPANVFAQMPTQQKPPAQPQQQQPQYSITVQSQLVQVNTVVTDQDGDIITGLKQQNFRI